MLALEAKDNPHHLGSDATHLMLNANPLSIWEHAG